MFGFSKKKNENNNENKDKDIVVIKKSDPTACGGTDATQDMRAPKTIDSEDMTLFSVTSALGGVAMNPAEKRDGEPLGFISAFASRADGGSFMYLRKSVGFGRSASRSHRWELVKADVMPGLVRLTRECDLAKGNGYHSTTHGLPENFGGSADIRYADGESISFSNNQFPVISHETARRILGFFEDAMNGEKTALPDVEKLREVRFDSKGRDGSFKEAVLTILPGGTGVNKRRVRFDDPKVYESEKTVDAATVEDIRNNIRNNGMLAWPGLTDNGFNKENKTLTFVFEDGGEVVVPSGRALPLELHNGFFNIELEMTVKH